MNTEPPDCVNLREFEIKFNNTCYSLWKSVQIYNYFYY